MTEIPLYHGTDRRMVLASKKDRGEYITSCNKVIDFLWVIFEPYLKKEPIEKIVDGQKCLVYKPKIAQIEETIIEQCSKTIWINFYSALLSIQASKNGVNNFQYGQLYLTGDKNKALNYAYRSFAGGEKGLFAYRLIQVAEVLGKIHDASEEIKNSIYRIKQFVESSPQPILLKVSGIDFNSLLFENGKSIDSDIPLFILQGSSYRYNKPYTLHIEDSIELIYDD